MSLTKEQVARYGRQLILPEIGVQGQGRLLRASVLVVGAGGLGSPAALYLAAAGVGRLGIIDREAVAPSNLHRQILHGLADVGRPKSVSARERLTALNPDVQVVAMQESLAASNARSILAGYDVILDGSDNFPTRYLVNDACILLGKPFVHGGVIEFEGQVLTVLPKRSACVRCLFPEPPQAGAVPSCQEAGVLGAAAGMLGSLMAHEALKLLLGLGEPLADRLLVFNGRASRFREVTVRRNPACAVCGDRPTIRELVMTEDAVCSTTMNQEGAWPGSR